MVTIDVLTTRSRNRATCAAARGTRRRERVTQWFLPAASALVVDAFAASDRYSCRALYSSPWES